MDLAGSVIGLLIACVALLYLRDAWVLILSSLGTELVLLVASYAVNPWRPLLKFDFADIRKLSGFGKWVVGSNIVVFFSLQLDNLVVGRVLGSDSLGLYETAFRFSQLPATQIAGVVSAVAFPALTIAARDSNRLKSAYSKISGLVLVTSVMTAAVVIAFANPFVRIVLGEQWMPIVPVLQLLTISAMIRGFVTIGGNVFYAAGKPQYNFVMNLVRTLTLAIVLFPLALSFGIVGVSVSVIISTVSIVPIYLLFVKRSVGVSMTSHITVPVQLAMKLVKSNGAN